MGLLDQLFGNDPDDTQSSRDWDQSVFDTDRFRNRNSGNWVDWEDVATDDVDTDGFEHPNFDEDAAW